MPDEVIQNPYEKMPDSEIFSKDPEAATPEELEEIFRRIRDKVAKYRSLRAEHETKEEAKAVKEKKPRKKAIISTQLTIGDLK